MTELLVGTRKGLFVLDGEPGAEFEVKARSFAGEPVEYANARSADRPSARVRDLSLLRAEDLVHG